MTSKQFCCQAKLDAKTMMNESRRMPSEFEMPGLRLDGRAALVTGGSRGLGLGMALALAHAGADVALAARTKHEVEEAATMVEEVGQQALALTTDVSDVTAVRAMVRKAADYFG